MKREHVIPDLLAAITADALFAPKPNVPAAQPAGPKRGSIFSLGRWFKAAPGGIATAVGPQAPQLTLDDDWVGGWYARTRLLQAATLAKVPTRDTTASTEVAGGRTKSCADVVSHVKDFS